MSNGVPPGVSLRGGVTTMSTDAAARLDDLEDADTALPDFVALKAAAPISIAGDYSSATVLAGVVAALVATGLFTDATTP